MTTLVVCPCGLKVTVDVWPFRCACGRVYKRPGHIPEPPLHVCPPPPASGPGTQIAAIFNSAGAASDQCGGICKEWHDQMNRWGVEGCRERRQEIIDRIKTAAYKSWVTDQIKIGWSISREPWFNPLDPVGCIVDEAIRRAEAKASLDSGS